MKQLLRQEALKLPKSPKRMTSKFRWVERNIDTKTGKLLNAPQKLVGDVWSISGRCLVDVSSMFGQCLVDICLIFGDPLVDVWSGFGRGLVDVWSMFC